MIEKNRTFREIAIRLKVNKFINSFFIASLWTFILGFLAILLSKLFSFNLYVITVLEIAIVISLLYALLDFFISRISPTQIALIIDKKLGLKERISSALLLEKTDNLFIDALKNDAQQCLNSINPREAFAIRLSPIAKYIFIPVIISLFIYSLVPDYDLLKLGKKRKLEEVTKSTILQEAQKLDKKGIELEKKIDNTKSPEWKKAVTELKKLSKELQNQKITRKEAMQKISELSEKLQKAKDQISSDKKLNNNINRTTDFDKLRKLSSEFKNKDYESASKTLSELSKKLANKEINPGDLTKTAEELSRLSDLMGNENPLKESLQKTAQLLNKNELQQASQELDKSSKESCGMG